MKKTRVLTQGALVATLYVVLTYVSNLFGLANGAVQIRLSEALTVLPAFAFSAVPGLTVGCFIANLLTGAALWDVVFGSVATLLGALGTYYLGKNKYLAPVFPIVANTAIIPFVLKIVYGVKNGYGFLFMTIFLGEFVSCGLLGILVYSSVRKTRIFE